MFRQWQSLQCFNVILVIKDAQHYYFLHLILQYFQMTFDQHRCLQYSANVSYRCEQMQQSKNVSTDRSVNGFVSTYCQMQRKRTLEKSKVKSIFGVTTLCLLNSVSSFRYNVSEVTQQVGFS